MEFLKREKKFVAVLAVTLLLLAGLHMTALSGLQNDAVSAKKRATGAWTQWATAVKELHQSVKDTKKIELGDQEVEADGYKVGDLTNYFRSQIDTLEDVKDVIISRLEWKPGPEFQLSEGADELIEATAYDNQVNQVRISLAQRYANSGDYAYVATPRIADPHMDQHLAFDIYLGEAKAWAGLVQPEEDDGSRNRRSRFDRRRRSSGSDEEVDEEDAEQQRRAEARARARLSLVLLSIANKVIEAGREARVYRVDGMTFLDRPEKMKKRFGVVENAASFYRPVCLQVVLNTDEQSLMRFLEFCVQSDFAGQKNQFLAIEALEIQAEQCLEPQPADQNVNATVLLVAWLVDTERAFSVEQSNDRGSRGSRYGGYSRRYR